MVFNVCCNDKDYTEMNILHAYLNTLYTWVCMSTVHAHFTIWGRDKHRQSTHESHYKLIISKGRSQLVVTIFLLSCKDKCNTFFTVWHQQNIVKNTLQVGTKIYFSSHRSGFQSDCTVFCDNRTQNIRFSLAY